MTRGHEDALAVFLGWRRRLNYSPHTIELEAGALRALLARLRVPLRRVRQHDVKRLLAARVPEVARNTAARELGTLRAFFGCLVAEGLVKHDPTAGLVLRYGPPAAVPLLLSREVIACLLAASLDEQPCRRSPAVRRALALRNRACLELLYGLGVRASEVHASLVVDLSIQTGSLLVRRAKRGEPRHLPLPPASVEHLARYLRDGRPHLLRAGRDQGRLMLTERGTPVCPTELHRIVTKIARRAGVRAYPHAFRRALATHLVRDGASLLVVQELLGHKRLDTTQRYVTVDRADLHRAVAVLERLRAHAPGCTA